MKKYIYIYINMYASIEGSSLRGTSVLTKTWLVDCRRWHAPSRVEHGSRTSLCLPFPSGGAKFGKPWQAEMI